MSWSNACDKNCYCEEDYRIKYGDDKDKQLNRHNYDNDDEEIKYNQYLTTNNYAIETKITETDLQFNFLNQNNDSLDEFEKLIIYKLSHIMRVYFKKLTKDYTQIYSYINSRYTSKYFNFTVECDRYLTDNNILKIRKHLNSNDLIYVSTIDRIGRKLYIDIQFKDLDPKLKNKEE